MSDGRAEAHAQASYAVRLDWGPTGAAAISQGADLAVVVDVLSFTTTLTVAVEQGLTVFPYRWQDDQAAAYAAERDAVLALGRFEARDAGGGVTLSPASMASVEGVERIVLPSPNGSTIAFGLADSGATVVGACLRNASAVAAWLAPRIADGATLAVVVAGERWPDGSLRPCLEDLWGAGAMLAALGNQGVRDGVSVEATHAAAAFHAVAPTLTDSLLACAGGRELVAVGFEDDVRMAAEVDASDVVPVLDGDAFRSQDK